MSELASYGILEARSIDGEVAVATEAIALDGCTVLPRVLTAAELDDLRNAIDELRARAHEAGGGRERLAAINEADIVRAPLALDERFLGLAAHPRILAVLEAVLGHYFIVMQQNAVVNPPAGEHYHQSAFHRDLPYQHFTTSRPLAANVLICIDPFDASTGGTFFVPGSHLHEQFPSDDYVRGAERQIEAAPGSALIMNSMLYHRAGTNHSAQRRRGVNTVYALPFVKQQIVLPGLLGGRYADDPKLARLLGYESDPPASIEAWYAGRFARTGIA